jgi:hypothetical protein
VVLHEVSSGFRFQVRAELSPWVSRLWEERPPRYSRAFLETLAIMAYRQPITRAEVEAIRGVAVSTGILKTLMEREWVRVAGHREVPGRPAVYVTTKAFLDYFGLKTLAGLPPLPEGGELAAATEGLASLGALAVDEGTPGEEGQDAGMVEALAHLAVHTQHPGDPAWEGPATWEAEEEEGDEPSAVLGGAAFLEIGDSGLSGVLQQDEGEALASPSVSEEGPLTEAGS